MKGLRSVSVEEFRADGAPTTPVLITASGRLIGMWEPGGDPKSIKFDLVLMERDAARLRRRLSEEPP